MFKQLLASLLFTTCASVGLAQQLSEQTALDPHFARKGGWIGTVSTGIPYAAIGEIAYGFTEGTTIGVIGGVTPDVKGYGLRWRSVLYSGGDARIYIKMPLFYYPHTKTGDGEPWMLTWPAVSYEWIKRESGIRYSLGLGVVAAACTNAMFDLDNEHSAHHDGHTHDMSPEEHAEAMRTAFMGGIWNTVGGSITIPVTESLIFAGEAAIVMDGYKVASKKWIGGPPVIVTLQISKHF